MNFAGPTTECWRPLFPAYLSDEPVGLGDVIKQATRALGIKPCGGCEARARVLNKWMVFTEK
jgi:hypothetical protein